MITKRVRAQLARLAGNPAELARALPSVCRIELTAPVLAMRASGAAKALTQEEADALLAKAVAGERVELELDIRAYYQKAGEPNRRFLRFRDGLMMSLGRTGVGTPFLRDHEQWSVLARAGTVTASKTEKLADGEYAIYQTVTVSAPWAVELALRGLLGAVSIGWRPQAPVQCSACDGPVQRCWHFPGERLSKDGPVVEWVYTEAELVETSVVNIGGVPSAGIDEIRAALSAHPGLRSEQEREGFNLPPENDTVDRAKLIALLGLALTASDDEILAAVEQQKKAAEADKAELTIAKIELDAFKSDIEALKADKAKRDEDKFVGEALASGRITVGEEPTWRALYATAPERARELMGKRPEGFATPAGLPRQSATEPKAPVITGGNSVTKLAEMLAANPRAGMFAHRFGYTGEGAVTPTLGATTIANHADLDAARVGFHAAFMSVLEQKTDDPLQEIYTEIPSTTSVEEHNWFGDLPGFEEWRGDRKLAGLEAFKLRVVNKDWASGLRIKANDFKDDKLGLLPPQVAMLAMKARRHRFDAMVKLLLNGFDGTAFPEMGNGLAYDGAFFFADAHLGGNDNKLTVPLDAAGLTAAALLLESMTTYDGSDPLDLHGTHLIVGPKLRATAEKLLTQERLANGEDNYHRGKYKLIVSNRIRGTFDDYWFLADLSFPIKPCIFQMREEITTSAILGGQGSQQDSIPRFQRNELWFGAEARYNVANFEFRTIVGSAVA